MNNAVCPICKRERNISFLDVYLRGVPAEAVCLGCMLAPFSPNAEEYGYLEGEVCRRDGCSGVIKRSSSDLSCSCHIAPPCPACIEEREFCPECDWDIGEEM